MKRNFLLFFLFLKSLIISSTIDIISEKITTYRKKQDYIKNENQNFPDFYFKKVFNGHKNYFNNTSNDSEKQEKLLQINKFFNNDKIFHLNDLDIDEDEFMIEKIVNNQSSLYYLNKINHNANSHKKIKKKVSNAKT